MLTNCWRILHLGDDTVAIFDEPVTRSDAPRPCTVLFRRVAWGVIALVLALLLFFAWWAGTGAEAVVEVPTAAVALTPPGRHGDGSGPETAAGGSGTGEAASTGEGTGADAQGTGPSIAVVDPDDKPKGDAGTLTTEEGLVASGAESSTPIQVPPPIGFTPADEPVVAEPQVDPTPSSPGGSGRGGAGAAGGGGTGFMGIETTGTRIVYILDFSGSMFGALPGVNPKIDHMLVELKRSINRLPDDHYFYIIFFDDGALPMSVDKMVLATGSNKSRWFKWADEESIGKSAGGGTDPSEALEIALKTLSPDTIYLLTDGGFDNSKPFEVIEQFNSGAEVQINTVGFHDRSNELAMQQIARENRGEYRYIPPPGNP